MGREKEWVERKTVRKALDRGVKTTMGERLGREKDWERKDMRNALDGGTM